MLFFSEGKGFPRHKATRKSKKIGIRVKNIYKLDVDGCASLMGKADKLVSRDKGELHHGDLKVMQQISTRLPKGTIAQIDTCKGGTMGKCEKSM